MERVLHERLLVLERYLARMAGVFAVGALLLFIVRFFLVAPAEINGPSMEPALVDSDLFLVNKTTYLFRDPRRFEVVQYVNPAHGIFVVKRVIGLPGETVVMKQGSIFLRDSATGADILLDESFYLDPVAGRTTVFWQDRPIEYVLGGDEYFVLGDNRLHSTDSRHNGLIKRSELLGKAFLL